MFEYVKIYSPGAASAESFEKGSEFNIVCYFYFSRTSSRFHCPETWLLYPVTNDRFVCMKLCKSNSSAPFHNMGTRT